MEQLAKCGANLCRTMDAQVRARAKSLTGAPGAQCKYATINKALERHSAALQMNIKGESSFCTVRDCTCAALRWEKFQRSSVWQRVGGVCILLSLLFARQTSWQWSERRLSGVQPFLCLQQRCDHRKINKWKCSAVDFILAKH